MIRIVLDIVSSIGSGLIASFVFALVVFGIKPKIKVSNCICVTDGEKENEKIYKIKVINQSRFSLVNVSYTLEHYKKDSDNINYVVTRVKPRFEILSVIPSKNDKDQNYAVRISYSINEENLKMDEKSSLVFTIQATHPFSNTSVAHTVTYKVADLRYNALFEKGKSMECVNMKVKSAPPEMPQLV